MSNALPQFLLTTALVNAGYFLIAMLAWWLALRILDIIGGQKFTSFWLILKKNPIALGIYLGARILAVAFLASRFIS